MWPSRRAASGVRWSLSGDYLATSLGVVLGLAALVMTLRPERVAQEHDGAEAEASHAEEGFETDRSGAVLRDHGDSEAGDQGEGAGQATAQAGAAGEEAAEGDGWDHAADDHRQGGGGESGAAGVVVGKGPQVGDGDSSMLLGGERGGHGVRAVGATKPPPFES